MKKLPLEKEVEAAFFDFVKQFKWGPVYRQVQLPLGIADIVGLGPNKHINVVEVKRGKIDRKTVGQLIGYIGQIDRVIEMLIGSRDYINQLYKTEFETVGILVGNSIDKEALSACKALGYDVYLYDCQNGEITFSEHIEYDKYLYYYVTDSDCSKLLLEISNEVVNYLKMFAEYYLAILPFDFPNSNWRNDSVVSSKVNGPEFVTAYKRGVKK